MLSWIREKFGTVVIGGIIGFIAFVFIFYGVFNPRSTRGLHEGAVAGKVNGDSITIGEFNRALNQRIEYFKSMMGNAKLTEEQLKAFRIRDGVFEGLVQRKMLIQEAERQGIMPSDEEVRTRIQEMPVFSKNGKFDVLTYRQVLEANKYTPTGFERMVREDLAAQVWEDYFRRRIHVSEVEMKKQFELQENRRNIKFVSLTADTGKKGVKIPQAEIDKFLADATKLNLIKGQYDRQKDTTFKGKTFDQVKAQLATEALAGEKSDAIKKINEELAAQAEALLKADKASDAKLNALLKPYGTEVKTSGLISQLNPTIPGVGNTRELEKDAFEAKSPIDPTVGGKPKKYVSGPWTIVAIVTESKKPDFTKFEDEKAKLEQQLLQRKEREIFEGWMKDVRSRANVDKNPDVVGDTAQNDA